MAGFIERRFRFVKSFLWLFLAIGWVAPKGPEPGRLTWRGRHVNRVFCILFYKRQVALMRTTPRAAAEKRSESTLVRDFIGREMQRGFDFERVRHLIGALPASRRIG